MRALFNNGTIWVLMLTLATTVACTRSKKGIEAPAPDQSGRDNRDGTPGTSDGTPLGNGTVVFPGPGDSEIGVPLSESEIKRVSYDIDTTNLTFYFRYIDYEKTGTLEFVEGKARLEFKGLTSGESADMLLELREGETAKLRGTATAVTLQPGANNNVQIVLRTVDGGGSSTDVVIDVTLDGGGTPTPTPSPVPSPTPSPVPSPTPSPVPSPTPSPVPSPTPSPDPLANWDGRSFRGNSQWDVVPVN